MYVKTHFWQKDEYYCDRCDAPLPNMIFWLCPSCYKIEPSELRTFQFAPDSYENLNLEGTYCCICQTKIEYPNRKDICFECRSNHVDNSHRFGDVQQYPDEFVNPIHQVRRCIECLGVRTVVRYSSGEIDFTYYRLGYKEAFKTPFECDGDKNLNWKEKNENHRASMKLCRHEWIKVLSITGNRESGLATTEIPSLSGLTKNDLLGIQFGESTFWCYKCGARRVKVGEE